MILISLRLGCNFNYDQLADTATYHRLVRQMPGLSEWDKRAYKRSTIHDNISKLAPETIREIDRLIISAGHNMIADPLKQVRGDSFVLKKNIHYPTDANLVCDGIRKCVEISKKIADKVGLPGWRQHEYLKKKTRRILRSITRIAKSRKADRNERLKESYTTLLRYADEIIQKAVGTTAAMSRQADAVPDYWKGWLSELQFYIGGTEYMLELAKRRVLEDEEIPHKDKAFSLFEPDTELINRGKTPTPIEFGHRVLIIQDNAGFIIHNSVLKNGFTDEKVIVAVMKKLQLRYNGKIKACSFDKGFWTPGNLKELTEFIPLVVLPKKGRRSEVDKQRESDTAFGDVRKWHAGVESAINALGIGNGMKVCRDKGCTAYDRYTALGTLGRNIHTLGKILIEKERKRQKRDPLMALIAA